ncbi:hypothetical protein SKAU_G00163940 [Synaphobranchus kaupii]|uniref:Placenta-specific protein 9 n=1 Tax=Synaphobranchus kaupii TaxID=118154 RepID=A0A9Q1FJ21_SYNKA|nr:hypothetical protein SKAU_G00163940 [Synaphobranchus kaupii]
MHLPESQHNTVCFVHCIQRNPWHPKGLTPGFQVSVMARPSPLSFGLFLLLIGQALTEPQSDPLPRADQISVCDKHTSLHDRLDVVEKRVEDTVQKLEAELSLLLDAIEAPEWRPLLDTAAPAIDILNSKAEGEDS